MTGDKRLALFPVGGDWGCRARDLGRLLGYAHDGGKLVDNIGGAWSAEFVEGVDLHRVTDSVTRTNPVAGAAELHLTRSGINLVCILTRKPLGREIRQWLAREVMVQIQETGTYSTTPALPSPTPPVPALPELSAMRYDAFQGQLDMIRRASQSRDDNLTRALVESNAAHDRATRQLASDVAFLTKQVAQLKAELAQGTPTKRPANPHRPNTDPEAEWENVDPNRVLVCRRLDNDSLSVYIRDEQDPRRSVIYVTRGRTQGTVATPPELRP